MPAYYSVLKYVPDPIKEESVNVALLVVDEDGSDARFRCTNDWTRIRSFAHRTDVSFLQEFCEELSLRMPDDLTLLHEGRMTVADLQQMASTWSETLQFTAPRASMNNAATAIERLWPLLVVTTPERGVTQERTALANRAFDRLTLDLYDRFPNQPVKKIVKRGRISVAGRVDRRHTFPLVLENGSLYAAAQSVSFNVGSIKSDLRGIYFDFMDVREQHPDLPLALVYAEPRDKSANRLRLLKDAEHATNELTVKMVPDSEIPALSREWTALLPATLFSHTN